MSNDNNCISVTEFLRLTGLTDGDLIAMLENGEIDFTHGPLGELLIDVSEVTPEAIAARSSRKKIPINEDDLALLEEVIASEIVTALDEIIDESLQLSLNWIQQKNHNSDDSSK